jgi:hypothetical protein
VLVWSAPFRQSIELSQRQARIGREASRVQFADDLFLGQKSTAADRRIA